MKLFSDALKIVAAVGVCLSVAGVATSADAAMAHKMTKKEKMAAMHCKEMHGTMMHGKCDMKKMKKN
jgi:hypothetical protein